MLEKSKTGKDQLVLFLQTHRKKQGSGCFLLTGTIRFSESSILDFNILGKN